jgi:hypothetical protein
MEKVTGMVTAGPSDWNGMTVIKFLPSQDWLFRGKATGMGMLRLGMLVLGMQKQLVIS